MLFSQKQYNILQRRIRHLNVRLDLINDNDVVVDSLEGIAIGGNINLSAESTNRRVGNVKIALYKTALLPTSNSRIWFNRKIGVWIGLRDYDNEIIWFNMGRFAFDEVDLDYNATDKIISINLKDYMLFLDGTLGGNLSHDTEIIAESTTINNAIRITVSSLSRVSIEDVVANGSLALVPYNLEFPSNSTAYNIVKELNDLYMGYEFFFDLEGYFKYQKIKDRKNDAIIWDFTQDKMDLSVSYTRKFKFGSVKNSIYVWGRQLENGEKVKWVYRNSFARQTINERNQIKNKIIGDICQVIGENKAYVWSGDTWDLLDFTVIPMFNIENIGEKIQSYSDDKIFNTQQAMLRAEYELKEYSNFAERVSFSCSPIYLLDVNRLIKLQIKDIGIEGNYLIKSISVPLDIKGQMNIEAIKMYY